MSENDFMNSILGNPVEEDQADEQEVVDSIEHLDVSGELDSIDAKYADVETINIIASDASNKEKIAQLIAKFKTPTDALENPTADVDPVDLSAELTAELEDTLEYYFEQFFVASGGAVKNVHDKAFNYMTQKIEEVMVDFKKYRGTVGELGEATRVLRKAKETGQDIRTMIEKADQLDAEIVELEVSRDKALNALEKTSENAAAKEAYVAEIEAQIEELKANATIAAKGQGFETVEAAEGEEATEAAEADAETEALPQIKGIVQLQAELASLGFMDFSAKGKLKAEIKEKQAIIQNAKTKVDKLNETLAKEKNALAGLKNAEKAAQAKFDTEQQQIDEKRAELDQNDEYRALRILVEGNSISDNAAYNEKREDIIKSALGLVEGSSAKLSDALDGLSVSRENLVLLREISTNIDTDVKVLSSVIDQVNQHLHDKHQEYKAARDAIVDAQKTEALALAADEDEKAGIEANFSPKQTPELIAANARLEAHNTYHKNFGNVAEQLTNFHQEVRENLQKNTVFIQEVDDKIKKTKRIRTSTIGKVAGEAGMVLNSLSARVNEGQVDLIDDMLTMTSAQAAEHFKDAVDGLVEHGKADNSRLNDDIKQIDGFTALLKDTEAELKDIAKTGAALREKKEDSLQDLEAAGKNLEQAKETGAQEGERAYRDFKTASAASEAKVGKASPTTAGRRCRRGPGLK